MFHEIGHKNYEQGGRPDGLLGDMMNVIEDIRVDRETIKARPGTCFNLEAITTHFVKKGSLEPQDLPQALLGKVLAYGFGRVLQHQAITPMEALCDEMMDDAFGPDFVTDVTFIIKNITRLKSTKDSTAMAQKLIDLLIQQQSKQQPPKPASSGPTTPQQNKAQNTGAGNNSAGNNGAGSSSASGKTGNDGNSSQQQDAAETSQRQARPGTPLQPNDDAAATSQSSAAGSGGNGCRVRWRNTTHTGSNCGDVEEQDRLR